MKNWGGVPCIKTIGGVDVPTLKCFEAVYKQILNVAIGLALLALFVMLISGGFRFLTAGGDPKAATAAYPTAGARRPTGSIRWKAASPMEAFCLSSLLSGAM